MPGGSRGSRPAVARQIGEDSPDDGGEGMRDHGMSEGRPVRVGFIGCGAMARFHLDQMLGTGLADVVAVSEPSPDAWAATSQLFAKHGVAAPPNEPDWRRFLATYAGQLDAAFIITPHAFHHEQATACLEAGLDVLLEKPMVPMSVRKIFE